MSLFWVCRLPSFPLWYLVSNSIYSWGWVRVRTLWHLYGTRKSPFACILPFAIVGCPIVSSILIFPLTWHGDQIQKLIAPHIIDKFSQIHYGGSSRSLIHEAMRSHPLINEQYCLLQYLPSDVSAPNPSEFLFHCFDKVVIQHPP